MRANSSPIAFVLSCLVLAGCAAQHARENQPVPLTSDRASTSLPGAGARTVTTEPSDLGAQGTLREVLAQTAPPSAGTSVATREAFDAKSGVTHVQLRQEVDGLEVFGGYVKASVNPLGQVVSIIDNLAPETHEGVLEAEVEERDALYAALDELYPAGEVSVGGESTAGNTTTFDEQSDVLFRDPTVTRVAIPQESGALEEGFLVETWSDDDNLLHHTLVSGDGSVLGVQLRTANDSYAIFPVSPGEGGQVTVVDPAGAGSPSGWLNAGSHSSIHIAGNNADAYLDRDNSNSADGGGSTVSDGNFVAAADLSSAPTTATNQDAAVQNLFYFNNLIHDTLYGHGFVESAGNFQENNFGNGGAGGDSVWAEAQDGGGTDNANFATPSDGSNPRMQMYLWNGVGTHQVVAGGSTYAAMGAQFGPALDTTGVSGSFYDEGGDGCTSVGDGASGNIAIIDRGNCDFVLKVANAEAAGATGVIVVSQDDSLITMGGTDTGVGIGSVLVGQTDGTAIRAQASGTIREAATAPLMRDGDLDSDIVWHEYGHGLTWRMIGNMSGPMSGAIGEGMSDVLALFANGDDVVGEYAYSNAAGIRSAPYTGYSSYRTYGDFGGSSVHLDGEIYAAAVWRLKELWEADGRGTDDLLGHLVQGMDFTPAGPAMEDMRTGILAGLADDNDPAAECLVWEAFAELGIGEGASTRIRGGGPFGGGSVTVTESFTVPAQCVACEPVAEVCDDGSDNDCDDAVDCDDSDCSADPACTCTPSAEACGDGVDNDCDGAIDCDDSDCSADPACDTGGQCAGLRDDCSATACCDGLTCTPRGRKSVCL